MYRVEDLYNEHAAALDLQLEASFEGLDRKIEIPEAYRPGLALAGFLKGHVAKRILIFGRVEMGFLKDLPTGVRIERLNALITDATPAVIIARRYRPSKELVKICENKKIPLFRTSITTMSLLSKLITLLNEEFSPSATFHGTLVEVFGVGVLIQGESSVGKSESALGLIERGHRLISDDVVKVRMREGGYLEGYGPEPARHHMEIRGIGIINVANLYGAVCVRERKSLDIVVNLEVWDEQHFYDRVGLDEKRCDILGVKVPWHVLPVKPGRDVVLLLETIALNHRLKAMGYNSAKEFNAQLLETLSRKHKKRQ